MLVKTADITSSKRSVAKNKAVGGTPNSNHLYGNAVDIHGSTLQGMVEEPMVWTMVGRTWSTVVTMVTSTSLVVLQSYQGSERGGNEQTADQENNNQGGKDIDQKARRGYGQGEYIANFGTYLNTLAEGIGGIFGDIFGVSLSW